MAFRPRPFVPTERDRVIPILYGADGFTAFCTTCATSVSPGPWPRATYQAAGADRVIHIRNHHEGAL